MDQFEEKLTILYQKCVENHNVATNAQEQQKKKVNQKIAGASNVPLDLDDALASLNLAQVVKPESSKTISKKAKTGIVWASLKLMIIAPRKKKVVASDDEMEGASDALSGDDLQENVTPKKLPVSTRPRRSRALALANEDADSPVVTKESRVSTPSATRAKRFVSK